MQHKMRPIRLLTYNSGEKTYGISRIHEVKNHAIANPTLPSSETQSRMQAKFSTSQERKKKK